MKNSIVVKYRVGHVNSHISKKSQCHRLLLFPTGKHFCLGCATGQQDLTLNVNAQNQSGICFIFGIS